MFQEITTYIIVVFAVALAGRKIYKQLTRKNHKRKVIFNNETHPVLHNCSVCAAECILCNASPSVKDNNTGLGESTVPGEIQFPDCNLCGQRAKGSGG